MPFDLIFPAICLQNFVSSAERMSSLKPQISDPFYQSKFLFAESIVDTIVNFS